MSKNGSALKNGHFHPSRILVPIDGSPNAKRALDVGIGIAMAYDSELVVMNVVQASVWLVAASAYGEAESALGSYYEEQEGVAEHFMDEALGTARARGVTKVTSKVTRAAKSVVEEIIETAVHEKIDLIVIGTRGLGGFKRLLQGSVSSGVVAHAHCSVLVVR